jgi:tetratricopeptide (TPR) repeat protein
MKLQDSRIMMFLLIGVLFLSISSVYAETAEEYFQQGLAHDQQGNLPQAISDYTKAIEINPNLADAYNNRAIAYYYDKEYDKSWADVHKAEELGYAVKPEFLEALKQASGRDK